MNTTDVSHTIGDLPRRSFLQLGVSGLAAGAVLSRGGHDGKGDDAVRRRTEQVVRRLLHAFESRDTAAIWSFFADDGAFEFPFIGVRATDLTSFDAQVGPGLAVLDGLTFTDLVFEPLADPEALIVKHNGAATVSYTGKALNEMYLDVAHLRHGKVTSFVVYYDTAVFNEALTP